MRAGDVGRRAFPGRRDLHPRQIPPFRVGPQGVECRGRDQGRDAGVVARGSPRGAARVVVRARLGVTGAGRVFLGVEEVRGGWSVRPWGGGG